jgi:hypothetical protein
MNQTLNDKFRVLASELAMSSFVSRHALQDRRSCCPGEWQMPVKKSAEKGTLMPTNHIFVWRSYVTLADE